LIATKNKKQKDSKRNTDSYFVVDDSASMIVVYSDKVLNTSVQYIWSSPFDRKKPELEDEDKPESEWNIINKED